LFKTTAKGFEYRCAIALQSYGQLGQQKLLLQTKNNPIIVYS